MRRRRWARSPEEGDSVSAPGRGSIAIGGDAHGPVTAVYADTLITADSAVLVAAAAKDPALIFDAVGVESFTGRDWLAGAVDLFMDRVPLGPPSMHVSYGFKAMLNRGQPSELGHGRCGCCDDVEADVSFTSGKAVPQ